MSKVSSEVPSINPAVILQSLNNLHLNAIEVKGKLQFFDDESLKVLYSGLSEVQGISWMLQADVVSELRSRATYGVNAVAEIAKFLEVEERRVHELAQIHDEILADNPELRETSLTKSHYLAALRATRYGLKPADVLVEALDNQMSANKLRKHIEGKKTESAAVRTIYYRLDHITGITSNDPVQVQYFSPIARTVRADGMLLLEVKETIKQEEAHGRQEEVDEARSVVAQDGKERDAVHERGDHDRREENPTDRVLGEGEEE